MGAGLDWRLMLPIVLVVSLDAASTGAILPILPFYLRELSATPLVFGLVLGAEALSQFVASPWLGQLSDRHGRRAVLLGSQLGALVSLCLLGVANTVVFVLLARVLLGLTAANFSAAAAWAADHSTPTQRRQAIGLLSAGLGLGGMLGPTLAGLLSEVSLKTPIWAALALSSASLCVTGFWLRGVSSGARTGRPDDGRDDAGRGSEGQPEMGTAAVSFRSLLRSPVIRTLVVVLLCHYFAYGMYGSQLPVFLADTFVWNGHAFGPRELGYLLAADGAINIVVQLALVGRLSRRFTERGLIVLVFGVLCTGYVVTGMAVGIPMLALGVLCISTGVALARPTFIAAISVHVPQRRQGIVMGAIQSLVALTDVASPVLAGLILGLGWYGGWVGVVVAIAIAGAVVARVRLRPHGTFSVPVRGAPAASSNGSP